MILSTRGVLVEKEEKQRIIALFCKTIFGARSLGKRIVIKRDLAAGKSQAQGIIS